MLETEVLPNDDILYEAFYHSKNLPIKIKSLSSLNGLTKQVNIEYKYNYNKSGKPILAFVIVDGVIKTKLYLEY